MNTSALVVGTNPSRLSDYKRALENVFDVIHEAATFAEAKTLLLEMHPDVLLAEIRLHEFNGIHLVLWSGGPLPHLRSVIIGEPDPVFERDANSAGAAYARDDDMTAIVEAAQEALARRNSPRRWPRTRLAPGVPARIGDYPARVLNVSYGGFCVETPASLAPSPSTGFTLDIPELGVRARATCMWMTAPGASGWHWCGAAVIEAESQESSRWRELVDTLSQTYD